jgi:hypothetical protein
MNNRFCVFVFFRQPSPFVRNTDSISVGNERRAVFFLRANYFSFFKLKVIRQFQRKTVYERIRKKYSEFVILSGIILHFS